MKRILLVLGFIGINFASAQDYSKNKYVQLWYQKYFLSMPFEKQETFSKVLNAGLKMIFETIEFANKESERVIKEAKSNKQISGESIAIIQANQLLLIDGFEGKNLFNEPLDKESGNAVDKMIKYATKLKDELRESKYSVKKSLGFGITQVEFNLNLMSSYILEVANIWLGFAKVCKPVQPTPIMIQSKL